MAKKATKATKAKGPATVDKTALAQVTMTLTSASQQARAAGDVKLADRIAKLAKQVGARVTRDDEKAAKATERATARLKAQLDKLAKAAEAAGVDVKTLI